MAEAPDREWARVRLLIHQRRYPLAAEVLEARLAHDPDDAIALATLSVCQRGLGQPKAALEQAQKAVALAPELAYTHYQLAWAYHQLNRHEPMGKAVQTALALDPQDADAHALEALWWAQKERPEAMLTSAEAGLRHDPQHLQCQLLRAQALIELWRWDEAAAGVAQVLRQDADNPHAHTARGWIYLRRGEAEAALADFQRALQAEPTSEWAKDGLMAALKHKNPLSGWYRFNPYGRALFAPEEIVAHNWLMLLPVVALVAGGLGLVGQGLGAVGVATLYGMAFFGVRARCLEKRELRVRSHFAAVLTGLSGLALGYAVWHPPWAGNASALLLSAAAGILAYLCILPYREFKWLFRIGFGLVAGLAGLGALILALSLAIAEVSLLGVWLGQPLVKMALVIFITFQLSRLQP